LQKLESQHESDGAAGQFPTCVSLGHVGHILWEQKHRGGAITSEIACRPEKGLWKAHAVPQLRHGSILWCISRWFLSRGGRFKSDYLIYHWQTILVSQTCR